MVAYKDGFTSVFKDVLSPDLLFKANPDLNTTLKEPKDVICLMGHNRWATQGKIVQENAHPFEFEKLIGAHNGTIQPYMLKKLDNHDKFEVDSQVIFDYINDNGTEKLWNSLEGAMALTWWNKEEKTLNIIKNKERPLFFVTTLDDKCVFWASEKWMLNIVLSRLDIKTNEKEPAEVALDTHIIFKIKDDLRITLSTQKYEPYKWKYVPPAVQHNHNHKGGHNRPLATKETVKVVEFHKYGGEEEYNGAFYGTTTSGQEVRISIESNDQNKLKENYHKIIDFTNKKQNWFSFPANKTFNINGTMSIHVNHLSPLPVMGEVPNKEEAWQRDKFFNSISPDMFLFYKDGGCLSCTGAVSWKDMEKQVVFDRMEGILCPICSADNNTVEEFMEREWLAFGKGYSYAN